MWEKDTLCESLTLGEGSIPSPSLPVNVVPQSDEFHLHPYLLLNID